MRAPPSPVVVPSAVPSVTPEEVRMTGFRMLSRTFRGRAAEGFA
jgi:hypothetical protein